MLPGRYLQLLETRTRHGLTDTACLDPAELNVRFRSEIVVLNSDHVNPHSMNSIEVRSGSTTTIIVLREGLARVYSIPHCTEMRFRQEMLRSRIAMPIWHGCIVHVVTQFQSVPRKVFSF